MKYSDCPLYGIRSKRMLKYVLQIKNDDMLKQSNITSKIHPYIDKTKKPRLIEAPQAELKIVQRRIKTLLGKIQTPDNVFSGIKGKSYPENARMHIGGRKRNLYKTDLTAFFPSISREDVYQFFNKKFYRFSDYLGTTSQMSELLGISSISGILRFGRYPAYHGISEPHLAVKSSKTVVENRPYY